jgi:hypothetical protein
MSLLNIFRFKPKPCPSCRTISPGLHRVQSGLRHGNVTEQLCTSCLMARLGTEIRGKSILFIEPLTSDFYCYAPFGGADNQGLTQHRVRLALASLIPKCADCSARSHHLWMPLGDLDEVAMQKLARNAYCSIPCEPGRWKETVSLCDAHVLERFRDYIEHKRYFFLTFGLPVGGDSGYYS